MAKGENRAALKKGTLWLRDFVMGMFRFFFCAAFWCLDLFKKVAVRGGSRLAIDYRLSSVNLVDADFEGWTPLPKFKKNPSKKFSRHLALSLAILSKMAYESAYTATRLCRSYGIFTSHKEYCTEVKANNVSALIFNFRHSVVVAFRGTQPTSLFDYITDLQAARRVVPAPNTSEGSADDAGSNSKVTAGDTVKSMNIVSGRLHHGILSALELEDPKTRQSLDSLLRAQLFTMLQDRADNEPKSLLLCGHSLGGALSTITAWKLKHEGVPVAGVYTIGAPMVSDNEFAQMFAECGPNLHRVVLDDDAIPRLPPSNSVFNDLHRFPWIRWIFSFIGYPLNYVHLGHLTHIVRGKKNSTQAAESTFAFFFRAVMRGKLRDLKTSALAEEPLIRKILRVFLPTPLNDHFPGDYVRALRILRMAERGYGSDDTSSGSDGDDGVAAMSGGETVLPDEAIQSLQDFATRSDDAVFSY